ncbi:MULTISPECIES: DUF424 domain-containing protein [Candidatus Nitrosocaldus]|jgi:hypothetical protein|nr:MULTISPECIES: DUF424 family protein [Candidatus Nitrosocaldus]
MYYSRSIQYQGSLMINICDAELIGSRIREGNLEVEISKDYFHERIGEEDAIALLRSCSIANLVGKRIVAKALEMRLASPHSVRYINGVPFLMLFKFVHTY